MRTRVLDLDGGVCAQAGLLEAFRPAVCDLRDWGPRLRLACGHRRFAAFEADLARRLGPTGDDPAVTFVGSGDFHHVTLALLRRIRRPFNLLMLDNHPDWMRGVPFLHCGTWLWHALRTTAVRRVILAGGQTDFDNGFRWLAPRRELLAGRVVVFPPVRPYTGGFWGRLRQVPLLDGRGQLQPGRFRQALAPLADDLARYPLYITFDKDVLTPAEAVVSWDSGRLDLEQAVEVMEVVRELAGDHLLGLDVVGDWSPPRIAGWARTLLAQLEHPRQPVDPERAARTNEATNLRLLQTLQGHRTAWQAVRLDVPPAVRS
ncbi:MAG: hypothetical protein U0736_25375 [Gemmataceae bacterium]